VAGEDDAAVSTLAGKADHRPDVLDALPEALERRAGEVAAATGHDVVAAVVELEEGDACRVERVESSRVSGCPAENTDPRPCTHTSAVRRRPRGSATTPSSQTSSRVAMRTSETATPTDLGITGHWPVRGEAVKRKR
jgi:hypothetical protein